MDVRDSLMEQGDRIAPSSVKGKDAMTFASRLASSAAGLAKNAVGRSSATDLTTPASIRTDTKLPYVSSSPISSNWMEDLPVRSGQTTYGYPESSHASFRSTPVEEVQDLAFKDFISSRTPFCTRLETPISALPNWTDDFRHGGSNRCAIPDSFDHAHSLPPSLESYNSTEARVVLSEGYSYAARDIDNDMVDTMEDMVIDSEIPTHIPDPSQSTYDWTAFINHYIEDGLGLENSIPVQLKSVEKGDVQGFLTGPIQSDGQALSRLKMIFDHIVQTVSSSSVQKHHSITQASCNTISQERFATIGASSTLSYLDQTSHLSVLATQHAFQQGHLTVRGQQDTRKTHLELCRRESLTADQDADEERTTLTFHCPWILCHQVSTPGCFYNSLMPMPF
ncbi:hypothetical protein K505DRAFT_320773 [Melanomma pulvis-pyrius CBS 109.77]|uniref:Uncharacterized protein n=1 Tax=Melanomma pulvis-pyrius CBS 109.77 TaxID=1314802 RepID=A0A6A6XU85_9PLEO|nr:hypothetical protein K505DRAFT_320773 [Melanomma pulvis-pyrius CBS 109.77]